MDLYRRVAAEPGVAARYREWRVCLARHYGRPRGDPDLFVLHTHLSTVARVLGSRTLSPDSPPAGPEELAAVVDGGWFRERDVYNFAEEDFFTWPLHPQIAREATSLCRGVADALAEWDPRGPDAGPVDSLHALLDNEDTPDSAGGPPRLADAVLSGELRLEDSPTARVLDAACRSGSSIGAAVRLLREAKLSMGLDGYDTLTQLTSDVAGVDGHPARVVVARLAYLYGLGDLVREPHPPVLVPVYLADPLAPPRAWDGGQAPAHLVLESSEGRGYRLPDSVAADPAHLDWLFHRLGQYLHGAQLRAPREGETEAIDAVMGPLYAYLTSPKRTGLRTLPGLDPRDAGVMCETARRIITLGLRGEGVLWTYLVKNAAAPVHLARRRFDLVLGRAPAGDGPAGFLARAASLYLREGGRAAVVLGPSEGMDTGAHPPVPELGPIRTVDLTPGPHPWRLAVAEA
ncbi:MAG: hypothetical protein J4F43_09105 [Dehalococcoidia bacterium]|nr:hypothetical protein [Dehalococcoidia bacterium]